MPFCHNVYGIVGLRIDAGFIRPVKNLLRNLDWKCTFIKHTVCRTVIDHCPVKGDHIASRTGQSKILCNNPARLYRSSGCKNKIVSTL